ncbi:MAG: mechanosensitive ion channel family protein [Cellvibrionaceae bacterium]
MLENVPSLDSLISPEMLSQATAFVITYGIKIVLALFIFIVGKWVAKRITVFLENRMTVSGVDPTISKFVKNILYYVLMVVIIVAVLGQVGIQTASFVAIIGAAGLAIGLALQGSLSNFAAGVLLILFRPIKLGDFVEVSGVSGSVKEISIFTTTLTTGDNKTVIIANSSVTNSNITNYSTQATRRVDLVVGVSYDSDIEQVKNELKAMAEADERILKDKKVTIGVSELADSSVNLVFRPWVNSADYWAVTFDLNEKIKKRFGEVGIGIPYPTMDLNVTKAD